MSTPPTNSGIRDNHHRGAVADFLKAKIHSGSRLSVVSAYFTIYAYDSPMQMTGDWTPVRRSWCLGDEQFRKELLAQMKEQRGDNHYGEEARESDIEADENLVASRT